ncbi:MAG TPA: serine/threonine-protein kinase, partial [Pyrinomonadaceae bacterium]|nr:serine/threonine-protein kinase [Pyrinomonadaceae bacterium]
MPGRNWKQVKAIFHEALRHESGERDVYLEHACGEDIDLRIEVESLLISLTEAKSFLETPLVKTSGGSYNKWQLIDGEVVSHYRIIGRIGVGGMGEVYLAEDDKLRRRVALKLLPRSMVADRERLRRFQREALAVSALNHPNILTIFEFDSTDEKYFLASEYVDGETLRARLKRDRLPVEDALDIAIQIVSAIQAAHKAGVIHRDIKPENVMIREDGLVKVLDFGLAKVTPESTVSLETNTQFLSNPGTLMGTASYMSPEQVRIQPIDKRSDIFSFGVVLYEMLSGKQPFTGDTNTDVIAAILQKEPEQLILKDSGHPAELEDLVNRCLEK